jgi:hypothetical protein
MAKIVWKIDNIEVSVDNTFVKNSSLYKRLKENWDKIDEEDGIIYIDSESGKSVASSSVTGFSHSMKSFITGLL